MYMTPVPEPVPETYYPETLAEHVPESLVAALTAPDAPATPIAIIQLVFRAAGSRTETLALLRRLAAGRDGVSGTPDDLIPAEVVDILAYLVQTGVAADVVGLLAPAARCCPAWKACRGVFDVAARVFAKFRPT